MQIKKIFTTLILSLFFVSSFAYAEVTTKGIGTVQMKSDDPTNVETDEAKNNALILKKTINEVENQCK